MDPLGHIPSKAKAKMTIVVIWIVAGILAIPNAIFHKFDYVYDESVQGVKPFCTPEELHHSVVNLHDTNQSYNDSTFSASLEGDPIYLTPYQIYIAFLAAVQYVLPLAVVAYSHVRMGIRLWTTKTPGNADGKRDETILGNKKRFVKMMAIVIGTFGICWFPWHFFHCLGLVVPSVMR